MNYCPVITNGSTLWWSSQGESSSLPFLPCVCLPLNKVCFKEWNSMQLRVPKRKQGSSINVIIMRSDRSHCKRKSGERSSSNRNDACCRKGGGMWRYDLIKLYFTGTWYHVLELLNLFVSKAWCWSRDCSWDLPRSGVNRIPVSAGFMYLTQTCLWTAL